MKYNLLTPHFFYLKLSSYAMYLHLVEVNKCWLASQRLGVLTNFSHRTVLSTWSAYSLPRRPRESVPAKTTCANFLGDSFHFTWASTLTENNDVFSLFLKHKMIFMTCKLEFLFVCTIVLRLHVYDVVYQGFGVYLEA